MGFQTLLPGTWRVTLTPRKIPLLASTERDQATACSGRSNMGRIGWTGRIQSKHAGAEGRFGDSVDGDAGGSITRTCSNYPPRDDSALGFRHPATGLEVGHHMILIVQDRQA